MPTVRLASPEAPGAHWVFLAVHLAVPALGVIAYVRLLTRMRVAGFVPPPAGRLFVLFFTYGGCLQVVLTVLFWFWSGLASLGMLYLVLFAPFALAAVAIRTWPERSRSRYHRAIFWSAAAYPLLPAAVAVGTSLLG